MTFSHNTEYLLGGIPMAKLIPVFNGSLYKLCSDAPNPLLQVRLIMISLSSMQTLIPIPKHLEFMQSVQLLVFSFRHLKTNFFVLQELLLLESAKTLAANVYEAFSQPTS